MKDKIRAYHKISQAIHSSRNELHLKTCSVMIGVFRMRFDDESIEALLKDSMDHKNQEILERRFRERRLAC
jgi:hypothetical protein